MPPPASAESDQRCPPGTGCGPAPARLLAVAALLPGDRFSCHYIRLAEGLPPNTAPAVPSLYVSWDDLASHSKIQLAGSLQIRADQVQIIQLHAAAVRLCIQQRKQRG